MKYKVACIQKYMLRNVLICRSKVSLVYVHIRKFKIVWRLTCLRNVLNAVVCNEMWSCQECNAPVIVDRSIHMHTGPKAKKIWHYILFWSNHLVTISRIIWQTREVITFFVPSILSTKVLWQTRDVILTYVFTQPLCSEQAETQGQFLSRLKLVWIQFPFS